ncbi:MAG: S1 RNA-binding domain-containing protein [Eubacterium sp.]|jgi:small subunit ribosomal protein S1|nr:S1 RNA-binding domain-containing protein [Eubacterium sp.]NBI87995.1 S1 RNA-binding domain-containing protein [Lachnospiraceae bacterium]
MAEEITTQVEGTTETAESMDDYKREVEASFRKLSEGDIITGTVIAVTEEEVTLDLKYYASGIIKADQFSDEPGFNLPESVHSGDVVEATIIRLDDGEGNLLLSKKQANDVLAWDKLNQYLDDGTVQKVRVKGIVPSGVIAYLEGIRGFIPASHLSLDYVEDCNPWLGKELDVRVITVDKSKKKLVLSAKVVARERAEEEQNHRISMLVPGTIVEGTVESIMPYGAFINIGDGLSGLVHISQICLRRIKTPKEVLEVGQSVKAKILNTNDNKISLSMRALEENTAADTKNEDESRSVGDYISHETASTSLGALLANIKLD